MEKELEIRIKKLEQRFERLSKQLNKALNYIEDDPHSSLTKSRTILEQILLNIYKLETGQEPKKFELGAILNDNQFTRKIDRRIISRMNAIRDMCNLGVHGEKVIPKDAKIVLDNLCEVLEWYFENYNAVKTENDIPEHKLVHENNVFTRNTFSTKRNIIILGIVTVTITILLIFLISKSKITGRISDSSASILKDTLETIYSQSSTAKNEQITSPHTRNVDYNTSKSNSIIETPKISAEYAPLEVGKKAYIKVLTNGVNPEDIYVKITAGTIQVSDKKDLFDYVVTPSKKGYLKFTFSLRRETGIVKIGEDSLRVIEKNSEIDIKNPTIKIKKLE